MQETQEMQVQHLGQEDPLEKEMTTHSSIFAWRIPWTEEPSRLQSIGSQRIRHDWAQHTLYYSGNQQIWKIWNFQTFHRIVSYVEKVFAVLPAGCMFLYICVQKYQHVHFSLVFSSSSSWKDPGFYDSYMNVKILLE